MAAPDNQQLLMILVAATLAVSVFILIRQHNCGKEGYNCSGGTLGGAHDSRCRGKRMMIK